MATPFKNSPHLMLLCGSLLVLLASCAGTSYVPVAEAGARQVDAGRHVVGAGQTLYSIAWTYGLDYRELARVNSIDPPYLIFDKQILKLDVGSAKAESSQPVSKPRNVRKSTRKSTRIPPRIPPRKGPLETPPQPVATLLNKGPVTWQWPVKGKIVKPFSLKGKVNKGIDIGVTRGTKIRAAASGVVVYAGGGLRGYGKLIIIKHSDLFLSAYGNNAEILVKEGQKVKRGKTISRMVAKSGTPVAMHFEIRRQGKPVPPLNFLPR